MARRRRYRISWYSQFCNFYRVLTLWAANKKAALKLISDRYPARRYSVQCL